MPEALAYIPPGDLKRANTFAAAATGNEEKRTRRERFIAVRDRYKGKYERYLDVKPGEPDDNIKINNVKIVIDRTSSMLFPAVPKFELAPDQPVKTDEENWLDDLWSEAGGVLKLTTMFHNGAFGGQVYVAIKKPLAGFDMPRIVNLDPLTMQTYWYPGDPEQVMWHEQYWSAGGMEYVNDYVRNPDTGLWNILMYRREAGGLWPDAPYRNEPWESIYGPIISWPHLPNANEFYGANEADNVALADSVNLTLSEAKRINRYHASPKTIALGIPEPDEINETAIDGLWSTAASKTEADIYNLEMAAPGQHFTEALLQRILDGYMAENRAVILRGDIKDFQRVTNPGIRTVFMDALSKNSLLQETYGRALQQISLSAAFLAKRPLSAKPRIVWPDPLPTDEESAVNVAKTELEMGIVSKSQVAAQRGYNFKEVQKLLAEQEPDEPEPTNMPENLTNQSA